MIVVADRIPVAQGHEIDFEDRCERWRESQALMPFLVQLRARPRPIAAAPAA